MTTYGQRIEWTHIDGSWQSVEVSNCSSKEEATTAAIQFARDSGWTPPSWWQWWRRSDTRLPEAK